MRHGFPYVHTMSDIIRQLSVRFRLPFLPLHNYFNKEATQSGFDAITTDGIHLTLYGHKLLAEKLFLSFKALITIPEQINYCAFSGTVYKSLSTLISVDLLWKGVFLILWKLQLNRLEDMSLNAWPSQ